MTNARENVAPTNLLTPRDYHIAGNDITAYYDAANKLVFVLDRTIDAAKPNVLLVISSVGDRKWDDILANDYNMDLETVRPKKDNKYQKLDIEYDGLAAYDELIAASRDGGDVDTAAAQLRAMRDASIRRAATDRLTAANAVASTARDTIVKTNDTIAELQARIKALRSKLAQQRREIGREPTKQSAAKILRTEAQIDVANEKLRRAKKRLANAQRRLTAAMADADDAQSILDMKPVELPTVARARAASVPAAPAFTQIAVPNDMSDASDDNDDADNDMNDITGDVQPLFDQDPKILDENIAFKPIEFETPVFHPIDRPAPVDMTPVASKEMTETIVEPEKTMDVIAPEPLTFTPPEPLTEKSTDAPAELNIAPVFEPISAPVLDTMKPLDSLSDTVSDDPAPISVVPVITESEPVTDEPVVDLPEIPTMDDTAAPRVADETNPMPEIEPAPADSSLRPVSPLTGDVHGTGGASSRGGRPTVMYYVMLIALIVLSIFTLWLYQKKSSNVTPDLAVARSAAETVTDNPAPVPAPQMPVSQTETAVMPEPGVPEIMPEPEWAVVETTTIDTPVNEVEPLADDFEPAPVTPDFEVTTNEIDSVPEPATEPEMVPGGDVAYNTIEINDDVSATVTDTASVSPMVNKPVYDVSPDDKSVVPVVADDMDYINDNQYYYSDDYAF